ncbi:MAG TPA: radical SAM family heme chaperone HemW [Ignavibacteriaceae bacterium]|nr:radical SAM family heme chaperone HemW [Ignavibacteriaceae bacterium]
MKNSALYVHIPFCDHKCIYCDFYSIITTDNIKTFLTALKKEIDFYSHEYSSQNYYTSIFFGGGTPSLMEPGYIEEIISHLKENFNVKENAEITLETNPGTVDKEKLKSFLKAGVNRISIGIQSFDDEELKFLTRIHNSETAIKTVLNATEAGFENISADLIFNIPGQTKNKWLHNLQALTTLPVKHISAYSLILERGTILNKMVLDGKIKMQDEDYDADLYEMTINFMEEQGFEQYEVSNFAKPDFECTHNKAYWEYRDYLSFGPSAHSFVGGKRWWNFSSLKKYIFEIKNNNHAVAGSEILNEQQMFEEYIMLALRSTGLNLNDLQNKFGNTWFKGKLNYFNQLKKMNLLIMSEDKIQLTKNGYALCDEILSNIL